MKKIPAIVFIILILFNVMGYYGLFLGLSYHNDLRMVKRLDTQDYKESETFVVKIPLTIPYATDSREFERVDGKFEYQGELFRMVKQRLSRDTIYVVCVRDERATQINDALESYVKTFADNPSDGQSTSNPLPTFIKDYVVRTMTMSSASAGWECDLIKSTAVPMLFSSYYSIIIHPPQRG